MVLQHLENLGLCDRGWGYGDLKTQSPGVSQGI